jgi:hypothetical protein
MYFNLCSALSYTVFCTKKITFQFDKPFDQKKFNVMLNFLKTFSCLKRELTIPEKLCNLKQIKFKSTSS